MLNRIANISTTKEYKGSQKRRSSDAEKYLAGQNFVGGVRDSNDLSSAGLYLTRAHWIIKELRKDTREKIFLDFIISNLRFKVYVDIPRVLKNRVLDYTVYYTQENSPLGTHASGLMQVELANLQFGGLINASPLKSLNTLFKRFDTISAENELTPDSQMMMEVITDGLENGLYREFVYINSTLFTFLGKMFGRDFSLLSLPAEKADEPVKITLLKKGA